MPDIYVASDFKKHKGRKSVKSVKQHRSPREYSTVMAKEKRTGNPLSAFMVRPKRLRFETQQRKEKILLVLRRHLITNFVWVLMSLLGLLAPAVFLMLPGWQLLPGNFQIVGLMVWYLLVVGYVIQGFLTWYFNAFLVTDERIIDIDFYSLLYKKLSSAKIEQIQDVTFTQGGVLAALFNFGDILIQTAGEKGKFDLSKVPNPRKVVLFLNEMILEEEREKYEGRVR